MCSQIAAIGLRAEILPWTAWPSVVPVWRELFRACPDSSFFVSEPWVTTWLEAFAPELDVCIAVFISSDQPVGACLLVQSARRRLMVPVRRISLNTSGEPAGDTTYVEYNTLLCRPGWEAAIGERIAEYVTEQRAEETACDGFMPGPAYDALKRAFARFDLEEAWHPCYYADLRELRNSPLAFEMALGRATRKHLRQNIRRYSGLGLLRLHIAEDTETALAMFDELAELNRKRWETRSLYPVFSSPSFLAFHRSLIARCFSGNSVELMRLAAGERTIGIIYNFLHDGTVYFYQCGLDYSVDPRLSPGTVTLFHAIQRSLEGDCRLFDFLSGAAPYKQRLATASRQLVWAVFRKPGLKTSMIKLASAARQRLFANSIHGADKKADS